MPTEAVELGGFSPVSPSPFDAIVCRRVIRLVHRLSRHTFWREAGREINLPANLLFADHGQVKMNPTVFVTLRDGDTAHIPLGNLVGEQRVKPSLRFLSVPQVAVFSARLEIAEGQCQESHSLFSEGGRHPLN